MRYIVRKPTEPFDPRKRTFGTPEEFYASAPALYDGYDESEAASVVNHELPDVLPLILYTQVGASRASMLGFLDVPSDARIDTNADLPFVMFVEAIPGGIVDKKAIKRNKHFNMKMWMPRVVTPEDSLITPIEVRSTALSVPMRVAARVGKHGGKFAVQFEIGGVTTSIVFQSEHVLDYVTGDGG